MVSKIKLFEFIFDRCLREERVSTSESNYLLDGQLSNDRLEACLNISVENANEPGA